MNKIGKRGQVVGFLSASLPSNQDRRRCVRCDPVKVVRVGGVPDAADDIPANAGVRPGDAALRQRLLFMKQITRRKSTPFFFQYAKTHPKKERTFLFPRGRFQRY